MASTLPYEPPVEHTPADRTEIVIDDGHQTEFFAVVSSETAQRILGVLQDDPKTASEIAEAIDTSLQNVHHHLEQLQAADLIERAGLWYSEKGKEMPVYGLATEQLIVRFGD